MVPPLAKAWIFSQLRLQASTGAAVVACEAAAAVGVDPGDGLAVGAVIAASRCAAAVGAMVS